MSVLSKLFCCCRRKEAVLAKLPGGLSNTLFRKQLVKILGDDYVAVRGEEQYDDWLKPYNRDKTAVVSPAAIVRPRNADEVAAVVKFAADHGFKVQAKGGGHSYANFSYGGPNTTDVIAIDLFEMQHVSVDPITWHATIGGGSTLGDITTKLNEQGGRAFAHGICPGVGIGGHATIGGLGPMSRMWGSALDHIVEVEVVTADGVVRRASEDENPDLFWALRGAASSLGIVTTFTMRTHPAPDTIVQYNYTFQLSHHSLPTLFKAWYHLISSLSLDHRLGTMFIIAGSAAIIEAIFYGSEADFLRTGLHDALPQPSSLGVVLHDWLGHLAHLAEGVVLQATNVAIPFYSKSLGFRAQDVLSDAAIDDMFAYLSAAPKPDGLCFVIFTAQGGATSEVGYEETAYGHRDKVVFYEDYVIPLLGDVDPRSRAYLQGFHALMEKTVVMGQGEDAREVATTYPGYVDMDLGTGEEVGWRYWGRNHPRLREVKARWDPGEVFWNPQSVRPSVGGEEKLGEEVAAMKSV